MRKACSMPRSRPSQAWLADPQESSHVLSFPLSKHSLSVATDCPHSNCPPEQQPPWQHSVTSLKAMKHQGRDSQGLPYMETDTAEQILHANSLVALFLLIVCSYKKYVFLFNKKNENFHHTATHRKLLMFRCTLHLCKLVIYKLGFYNPLGTFPCQKHNPFL